MGVLTGKKALITGSTRGLGLAIARAFADEGADVAITGRGLEACRTVATEIEAKGRRSLPLSFHAGRWEAIPAAVEECYARWGRLDVLVNNVGKSPLYDRLDDISEAMFDAVVSINLKGPFRLSVLVGTRMAAHGGGAIVNISSTAAINPDPGSLPYAAAKAGVEAMTVGLARAFAPTVRVNTIRPGAFATDVSEHWTDEVRAHLSAGAALGRIGEPAEIVGAALYLASDAASFTTGATLAVDGGLL